MRFLLFTVFVAAAWAVAKSQNQLPPAFAPIPPLPGNMKPSPTTSTKKPVITKAPITQAPTTRAPITQAPTTAAPTTAAPTTAAPTTSSKSPNCGLNVNVAQNPNCIGGNSAVQQTLTTLKQELDKARQQQQAQSSAVQGVISLLQSQQNGYVQQISDLQNEVKNLVMAFNTKCNKPSPPVTAAPRPTTAKPTTTAYNPTTARLAPSTASPSASVSAALQQSVLDVRSDLTKAIQDFNNEVFNVTTQIHDNQLQESKQHQMIETQIVTQGAEIGRLTQRVGDLNKLLLQLQSASGSNTGSASPADVQKLTADIQKVAKDLAAYDQNQQSQIKALSTNTTQLLATSQNNSAEIRSLQNTAVFAQAQLNKVQQDTSVVHDALALFRKQVMPQLSQLDNDIKAVNLTSLLNRVNGLSRSLMKLTIKASTDSMNISALELQSQQLKADVQSIQGNLTAQASEITGIKHGIVALKTSVPVKTLNDMNNAVLTILSSPTKTPTPQQLQDLKNGIQAIIAQLNKISLSTTTAPQSG